MGRKLSDVSTNVEHISTNEEIAQDTFVENMSTRVRLLAERARFNAKTLAEAVKVPVSSASNYWSGKRPWPIEVLPRLAAVLSTNVDFLLTGEHPAKAEAASEKRRGFRGLERARGDLVQIAQIDLRYGLGATYLDGAVATDMRPFSRDWFRHITRDTPDSMFWAVGDGDSMEPTIRSGELVLIDGAQKTPRMGEGIWAVAIGEIGMIKRIHFGSGGSVQLLSDNQLIPPIPVGEEELHVVGRVVAVVRRL